MYILSSDQIKEHDTLTRERYGLSTEQLMEQAAVALTHQLVEHVPIDTPVWIFCGSGNNGGDGLAISRLLLQRGYSVFPWLVKPYQLSPATEANLIRLQHMLPVPEIHFLKEMPEIPSGIVIIDAIFGSGLNRPVEGLHQDIIRKINQSRSTVISIDMPSGLYADTASDSKYIIQATRTLTIEYLKKSMMMACNAAYVGDVTVVPIGLVPLSSTDLSSSEIVITPKLIQSIRHPRSRFGHKGTFGKAYIMCGSQAYAGAALLTTRACMRSGVGYTFAQVPAYVAPILTSAVPEVIVLSDNANSEWSTIGDFSGSHAVAFGPGVGVTDNTQRCLKQLLDAIEIPLVLDASALEILSLHPDWWPLLDPGTILTPHPKEMDRLLGEPARDDWDRLSKTIDWAVQHKVIVVLKGAYTCVVDYTTRNVYFNTGGNSGMGTAGSGDVLTGVIVGLLAQGYTPLQAAMMGVYEHARAGDAAAAARSEASMIAGDIIDHLRI